VNVEVIRSPRRRKTVQARRVNGVVRVTIPATMTRAEEERWVAEMVRRLERSKLAAEPGWVLDYVIVHELAHLVVPGHGRRFWGLVDRYPRAERARGWLMARAAGPPPGVG
jgi:predicted metal-dependent hydrolase